MARSDGNDFHFSLSSPLGTCLTLPTITELPVSLSSLNSQQKYLLSSGQRQVTLEMKPETFRGRRDIKGKIIRGSP